MLTDKNRIMIYGPRNDGTYIVEFKTADGEALAISVTAGETRVLKHFQERMLYGLFVPDVPRGTSGASHVFLGWSPRFKLSFDRRQEGSRGPARATSLGIATLGRGSFSILI
jgi:hypothetical protein